MSRDYGRLARTFCIVSLSMGANLISAQGSNSSSSSPADKESSTLVRLPKGMTEAMLVPPPVPSFMLKRSTQPLSVEEMERQAREAEQRAGIRPTPKPVN